MTLDEVFQKNVRLLTQVSDDEQRMLPAKEVLLPSVDAVREIITLVKKIVFPGFFDKRQSDENLRSYHIGVNMEQLLQLLRKQIALALQYDDCCDDDCLMMRSKQLAYHFIDHLPQIKHMLYTDVKAIYANDPAVNTYSEVIFCYPVIEAMTHYRVAHDLLRMGVPVIPRIIAEQAHAATGIDIHPGARIGEYFSIDHGTGVVIGATCVIGNHVTLYQGVTLGSKNFKLDSKGFAQHVDTPRHPVLEDNVTIYSNSTLLGHITIGHDTIIGGNIWVTNSVPPHSKLLQSKALDVSFSDGLGI
uniref:Serine acetyltransferase n=3 Tax=unclassified Prevotella TaxID=2638335 RepID=A0AB33JJ98_9BACT